MLYLLSPLRRERNHLKRRSFLSLHTSHTSLAPHPFAKHCRLSKQKTTRMGGFLFVVHAHRYATMAFSARTASAVGIMGVPSA